jgi:hypothetical protein
MDEFCSGAIAMASVVIALFFLRFWRNSHDRFFLYFSLSFMVQAGHRCYITLAAEHAGQDEPLHYLIRLLAYSLILWAVLEKNWPRRKHRASDC